MALKEFIGENRLAQVLTLLKNHIMTGASSGAAGASGFVPAPSAGDQDKVLKGDGTWGTVASDDTFTLKNQSLQFAVTTETVDYTVVDNEGDFAVNKSDIDSIVISCSTYPIAQLCVYYSDGYADHSEVFRDATEPITLTLPSGKDTVSHIAYGMDDGNLTFSILFNKHTAVAGNHVEIANTNVTANSYVEAYFNDASIATATNSVVSVRAEAGKIVFDSAKSMLNTLVCDIVVKNSGSTTSTTYTKGQTNIFSVPNGGNTAEVLEKQSSANGDVAWAPVATQMTWAQYQALTTDQKNDGRVRVITDRNMSPILAEGQTAVDTEGIVTTAGGTTNTQALLDGIAAEVVASSESITLESGVFSDVYINRVVRVGKAIFITLMATIDGTLAGSSGTIGTLPSGCAPSSTVKCLMYGQYGSNSGFFQIQVSSAGTIKTATGSNTFSGTVNIVNAVFVAA